MELSEKRLAANRANAEKSTGPRTEAGKSISRHNAFKHGLTGNATIMTIEDAREQRDFTEAYIKGLNPVGPAETQLAGVIALDNWRLNRAKTLEENTLSLGEMKFFDTIEAEHPRIHHAMCQAAAFSSELKTFNTISLHEQRITRGIHKNMRLYWDMQDRRKAEAKEEAREQALAAREPKPLTRAMGASSDRSGLILEDALSQPEAAGHGFVFSTDQTPAPTAQTPAPEALDTGQKAA
jgi:hypothetical protein